LRYGALFAGYGGLELGARSILGGEIAWVAENDPGACRVLAARAPAVPNHGDVTTVDWSRVEPVDVLAGGTPCQDVSEAGRRLGFATGSRSNLWVAMRSAIAALHPRLVLWENVRGATFAPAASALEPCSGCVGDPRGGRIVLRALGRVLGDLADLGYDAAWTSLRASDVGAPHNRFRTFLLAWRTDTGPPTDPEGREQQRTLRPRTRRSGSPDRDRRPVRLLGTPLVRDAKGVGPVGGPAFRHNLARHYLAAQVLTNPIAWGKYEPAIRRWEDLTRPAPPPIADLGHGPQLAAEFSEWMLGLPAGYVTDPDLWADLKPASARRQQLRILGNGVVPQQAAAAYARLLADDGEA
jgi:DNA (cytosine-5)-methyltransferase 1